MQIRKVITDNTMISLSLSIKYYYYLYAGVSAVDKDHRPGRFVLLGQVLLVNAVGQGGGRGLVHQL